MSQPLAIATAWIASFNRHDVAALLGLYHEDARHYSPKLKLRQPDTGGIIQGKPALRVWWQEAFDRLPSLRYEQVRYTAGEERVFFEYLRVVDGEEDLAVAEVLDIEQGLITGSRVYHG